MSAWLDPEEVIELTECKRRDVQCRRLAELGIPFRQSYGGRPLVERAAVLRHDSKPILAPSEPNWVALDEMIATNKARNKR